MATLETNKMLSSLEVSSAEAKKEGDQVRRTLGRSTQGKRRGVTWHGKVRKWCCDRINPLLSLQQPFHPPPLSLDLCTTGEQDQDQVRGRRRPDRRREVGL